MLPQTRRSTRAPLAAIVAGVVALTGAGWIAAGGERKPAPSALLPGGITASPSPGTRTASPQTEVSFLGASPTQLGRVTVVGSRSGRHPGRVVAYASARGASFVPRTPFAAGERVTVTAAGVRFMFMTSRPVQLATSEQPVPARPGLSADAFTFASAPDLHPARVSVGRNTPGASNGYVFLAPLGVSGAASHGQPGPLILDSAGNPVWQATLLPGQVAMNFGPQTFAGHRVLTWWEGQVSPLGYGIGEHVIVDSSYRTIATIQAGNGYSADLHELQLTRQGSAFITAYRPIQTDLRRYGGSGDGELLDSVVQEIDVKTGRVMFEWDPLDHLSLADSYTQAPTSGPWDPIHLNAVDATHSGELLVTARNTWAAYDVNARSGQIAWRLGGKRSSFRLARADRFAWEHDARFQPGGRISVFDDEAAPQAGSASRGILFGLDEDTHSARAVTRFDAPGGLLSSSQGNLQSLPNGHMFAGWGAQPHYSEFTEDGQLVYDAALPKPDESYRAFRGQWHGRPAAPPSIAVSRDAAGRATVYASWNGATDVAAWRLLAGPTASALAPAGAPVTRGGFETAIATAVRATYFAVQALDASGRVLATSPGAAA